MSLLPQFGFIEMMVVAIVALIVIGPKDLPRVMRSFGQILGKARRMAGEFTAAFDDMAREAEVEELRREMEAMKFENLAAAAREEADAAFQPVKEELDKTVQAGKAEQEKAQAAAVQNAPDQQENGQPAANPANPHDS